MSLATSNLEARRTSGTRSAPARPMAAAPNCEFDGTPPVGYEILYPLGHGTFSEVWKVSRTMTGHVGALKRLRPQWRNNAAARQLLRNEAEVGRVVKSPHVVRVLHAETSGEDPFVVLDWLDGRSVEDVLWKTGRFPIRRALWVARQCAAGLSDLEQAGFAHGDIKPSNLFLCANGETKLVDLGFARSLQSNDRGTLTGTPEYMAPESLAPAESHPVTRDIYSLGITLYQILTGQLPFSGDDASETIRMQRGIRPTELRKYRPEASRQLSEFVGRLLAKHPIRRPASLQAVVDELVRLELATLTSADFE